LQLSFGLYQVCFFDSMKIQQIHSVTFLRRGAWVATVMSTAAVGGLESTYG